MIETPTNIASSATQRRLTTRHIVGSRSANATPNAKGAGPERPTRFIISEQPRSSGTIRLRRYHRPRRDRWCTMTGRMARAIDMGDGTVGIFCQFDDKDRVKALPTSRWDPATKCWRVSAHLVEDARRLVAELNGTTATPSPGDVGLVDAFANLFRLLPEPLRAPTYRALAKILHPDAGGDEAVAKALTAAWAALR